MKKCTYISLNWHWLCSRNYAPSCVSGTTSRSCVFRTVTFTHTLSLYIYICVCVCVYMYIDKQILGTKPIALLKVCCRNGVQVWYEVNGHLYISHRKSPIHWLDNNIAMSVEGHTLYRATPVEIHDSSLRLWYECNIWWQLDWETIRPCSWHRCNICNIWLVSK